MFRIPTRVLITPGSRFRIPEILESIGAKRCLLLTDVGVRNSNWFAEVQQLCGPHDLDDSVQPNPKSRNVDRLGAQARAESYDVIIGIGGGSVLDAAKAVSMLATNEGSIVSFEGKNRFQNPAIPFLAIPTTCGTGSEVTWVSVISVPEQSRKISVKGDAMFPAYAIVDADLIRSLPISLIASTGMDAFTHAIEAVVGKPANPVSDALALNAISLLMGNLVAACDPHGPIEAKEQVMLASTVAGMAFGNADVGAVHCLSESIGGLLDLPHGLLNTLLLTPVLRYQQHHISEPLGRVSDVLNIPRDAFFDRLQAFVESLPLPPWSSMDIKPAYFDELASNSESNGSTGSNRMDLRAADYLTILKGM